MGLLFLFEDKREVIPVVEDLTNLEYDITSKIKKLTEEKIKTIGFTTGHSEIEISENLRTKLNERYTTKEINLKDSLPIICDALIISGPKNDFDTTETKRLLEYINNKGPLGVFLDRFNINLDFFLSFPLKLPNLDAFLSQVGFNVEQGMIMDRNNEIIVLRTQHGQFVMQNYIPYPYFPKITDLSRQHPITKDFEAIVLPFVSPVSGGEGIARTSKASWLRNSPQSLNPVDQQKFLPFLLPFDKPGPFNTISFLSSERRMVVVGTSKFIDGQFLGAGGMALFMNILDWLTQDEALISIRSKAVTDRPLKEISKGMKTTLTYLCPLLPSLIFVVFGIIRWRMRKGGKCPYEI